MRIGKIIGNVTMNALHDALVGGRFLLVEVQDRLALAGKPRQSREALVVYDHLGASVGELIAFSARREATMTLYPEKCVPIDAYCSAILDRAAVSLEM